MTQKTKLLIVNNISCADFTPIFDRLRFNKVEYEICEDVDDLEQALSSGEYTGVVADLETRLYQFDEESGRDLETNTCSGIKNVTSICQKKNVQVVFVFKVSNAVIEQLTCDLKVGYVDYLKFDAKNLQNNFIT